MIDTKKLRLGIGLLLLAISIIVPVASIFLSRSGDLKIANTTVRFEEMFQGENINANFVLTNDSNTCINVYRVVCSCGCLKIQIAKPKLLPGETSELTVTANPESRRGIFEQSCEIFYNFDGNPDYFVQPISVVGKINPDIVFPPNELVFGPSQSNCQVVKFEPGSLNDFSIVEVVIQHPAFSYSLDNNELKITFDALKWDSGGDHSTLRVRTSSLRAPWLTIKIFVNHE